MINSTDYSEWSPGLSQARWSGSAGGVGCDDPVRSASAGGLGVDLNRDGSTSGVGNAGHGRSASDSDIGSGNGNERGTGHTFGLPVVAELP